MSNKIATTPIIAVRLANLRTEQKLTQTELASLLSEVLGRSFSFMVVSSWETGRRTPAFDVLQALSNIYDCSLDYIVGNTDDRHGTAEPKDVLDVNNNDFLKPEVKLLPEDILRNRCFDGKPVFITFKNYAHPNQWALVNLKKNMFILSDNRMLKINTPSIDYVYTNVPTYESSCSINGNYPLDLSRLKKRNGDFYVEMISSDKEVCAAYNGWYHNNEDRTCIINSVGRALPYTGLGISYNAYTSIYKQDSL